MTNLSFYSDYYEQPRLWGGQTVSSQEEDRIQQTLSLIPEECCSILEVGCGDGRIINRLVWRYGKVCGLDVSTEALRHVMAERILGSIDSLPFSDKSFDLVICCEVLEHLPFKVYPKALKELQRVTATYIIVSVPNRENVKQSLITCPQCGCAFHPSRHLRSFQKRTMLNLFTSFSLQVSGFCGPSTKAYPYFVVRAAKFLKLIPNPNLSPYALCPQCGYTPSGDDSTSSGKGNSILRFLLPLARRLIPAKKVPLWLLALYHQKS